MLDDVISPGDCKLETDATTKLDDAVCKLLLAACFKCVLIETGNCDEDADAIKIPVVFKASVVL